MEKTLKSKLFRSYTIQKIYHSANFTLQKYHAGEVAFRDLWRSAHGIFNKNMTYMTYFDCDKGFEMEPSFTPHDTLLVRNFRIDGVLPFWKEPRPKVNVGDVVVLKDSMDTGNLLVRRLAAVGGFGGGKVISDKKRLHPKERKDSRSYEEISISNIVGRVIYRYRTPDDHGFVENHERSMRRDLPVYLWECDKDEIRRFTETKTDQEISMTCSG